MLISHEREKLINAVVFFSQNTRFLGKTKLFKLLYFIDFRHYQEAGRSITGLEYFAWPMGPVPIELNEEVSCPAKDMRTKVSFQEKQLNKGPMLTVSSTAKFDPDHFTKRELRLLKETAEEFRNTRAKDMVEATHLENQPWHIVYKVEGNRQSKIPYDYAIKKGEKESMGAHISEREEFVKHFSSK